LNAAEHVGHVAATDVSDRALAMTRLNATLNDVNLDVRSGSHYEPVQGETIDQVVTNPPFVVTPATGAGWSTATRACRAMRWCAAW